jgi:uncharacterized repeat protein (TIGR02543 family)
MATFTITFITNGGSSIPSLTLPQGATITPPNNPIKEGYAFAGWHLDQSLQQPTSIPQTMTGYSFSIYAKWLTNSYTIEFMTNGGTPMNSLVISFGASIPSLSQTTTKLGHTFVDWYFDANFINSFDFRLMPPYNLTLYAKWSTNQYTVTFNSNGGTNLNAVTDFFATPLTMTPTKTGYSFTGWFKDALLTQPFDSPYAIPAENLTVYAKWAINRYTVSFSKLSEVKVSTVSAGGNHSVILTSNKIYSFGFNDVGQLGDGTTTMRSSPTDITSRFSGLVSPDKIISVSLGYNHSAALSSSGRVFMWGLNDLGQLGDGTTTMRSSPTDITSRFSGLVSPDKIISVSLGGTHSAALSSSGRVFMWGSNGYGQLGDGTTTMRSSPTDITSRFSGLVSPDKITSVSLGGAHSAALSSSGRVFMWGLNGSGQLGDGNTIFRASPTEITSRFSGLVSPDKITYISLGDAHSAALSSLGRVFMWGLNGSGQLGDGTTTMRSTPTNVTSRFSGLVSPDKIISVSLGIGQSAALSSSGQVFTWGFNGAGHLGDGTTITRYTPSLIFSNYYENMNEVIELPTIEFEDSITLSDPTMEGYTFAGWFTNVTLTSPFTLTTMPAENLMLYAKFDLV